MIRVLLIEADPTYGRLLAEMLTTEEPDLDVAVVPNPLDSPFGRYDIVVYDISSGRRSDRTTLLPVAPAPSLLVLANAADRRRARRLVGGGAGAAYAIKEHLDYAAFAHSVAERARRAAVAEADGSE